MLFTLVVLGPLVPSQPALAAGATISRQYNGADYRPAVAESPDGSTLVAIWYELDSVRSAVSRDGGGSWSDEIDLGTAKGVYLDSPRVAYDGGGNLHAVWMSGLGDSRSVRYRHVPRGGDPANPGAWRNGPNACTTCVEPDLTVDFNGRVHVIFRQRSGEVRLGIRRLAGPGAWEAPTRYVGGAHQGDMVVTPDGRIHVVYNQAQAGAYYERYVSFENFRRDQQWRISFSGDTNLVPAIAADRRGHVHMAWIQGENENQRLVFYREHNGGTLLDAHQVSANLTPRPNTPRDVDVAVTPGGEEVFVTWTGFEENSRGLVYQNRRQGGAWRDPRDVEYRRVTSNNGSRQSRYGLSARGGIYLALAEIENGVMTARFLRAGDIPAGPPEPTPPPAPSPEQPPPGPDQPPAPEAPPAPNAPDVPPPGCAFFLETARWMCGGFANYWNERGGLARFGYPLSDEIAERNPETGREYTVQYFERARFEYHRDQAPPHDIQLGLLGRAVTGGRGGEAPFQPMGDPGDGSWFAETGHTLRGGFRAHWEATGGLPVHGFPISEEFEEVNPDDGRTYVVQYFERNRFEYHPELAGTPFEVTLGQLGRQVFRGL